jgi:hypothetical protein
LKSIFPPECWIHRNRNATWSNGMLDITEAGGEQSFGTQE